MVFNVSKRNAYHNEELGEMTYAEGQESNNNESNFGVFHKRSLCIYKTMQNLKIPADSELLPPDMCL